MAAGILVFLFFIVCLFICSNYLSLPSYAAWYVSYFLATGFGFTVHRSFTFKDSKSTDLAFEFGKFIVNAVLINLLTSTVYGVVKAQENFLAFIATPVVLILSAVLSYVSLKLFVFKCRENDRITKSLD